MELDAEALSRWWSLRIAEIALIETKPAASCLGFAAQIKLYLRTGCFADQTSDLSEAALHYLTKLFLTPLKTALTTR